MLNNWYPTQRLLNRTDYGDPSVDRLAKNAKQAFFDYHPLIQGKESLIYRRLSRGPLCELFFLDMRSYRGPNSTNRQTVRSSETDYLGDAQLQWLKKSLVESRAVWKVVCSDMPLGLMVRDVGLTFENSSNGDGPPLGRELEIADLLSHLKKNRVRNVIWLTADVHYAASHYYNPARAQFADFDGFWEFVSGPLHAGTFGPVAFDNTFGPEVRWTSRSPGEAASGPWTWRQFFGIVRIDPNTRVLTVTHFDRDGRKLASTELAVES